jgi:hypothetical protein
MVTCCCSRTSMTSSVWMMGASRLNTTPSQIVFAFTRIHGHHKRMTDTVSDITRKATLKQLSVCSSESINQRLLDQISMYLSFSLSASDDTSSSCLSVSLSSCSSLARAKFIACAAFQRNSRLKDDMRQNQQAK